MRYSSIRSHLKPYGIVAKRKTTINHAFAAAIAPSDTYDEQRIRDAISALGQNPDQELMCVYCGSLAETWDHVFATVKDSKFSGHGHRLGNLLPCCKLCNSRKGNKDWRRFLMGLSLPAHTQQEREHQISVYLSKFFVQDTIPGHVPEYERLQHIKQQVMLLLAEADELAKVIRKQAI